VGFPSTIVIERRRKYNEGEKIFLPMQLEKNPIKYEEKDKI
jgi:hypothetical protein